MLKIIGMGIGTAESLTLGALNEMKNAGKVVLQTERVPVADFLRSCKIEFETIDDIYSIAQDFDELCCLTAKKIDEGVFCVLGSVASNLIAQEVIKRHPDAQIVPGMSFAEGALSLCKLPAEGAQIYSAASFEQASLETDKPVVVTEVDSHFKAADVVLKLSRYTDGDVFVINDGKAKKMPIYDVNWINEDDWSYNSAIVMPALLLKDKLSYTFSDLMEVMGVLRGFNGCPWDKKQTHKSLRQYLIEESYEAIDAIDDEDDFALCDELGDVLFQIAFHAKIGDEQSSFDALDVTTGVCKKMISRHTHIFGKDKIEDSNKVALNWEKIKREEKGQSSLYESMSDVTDLSPIIKASKMQKKAALSQIGVLDKHDAAKKVVEDAADLYARSISGADAEKSGGEILFDAINLMRILGISAEAALHEKCREFLNEAAGEDEHTS